MTKKKILILGNSASGLYDFRNELVLSFLEEYEVYISLPDEEKAPEFEKEGCHVIHTDIDRRGMNPLRDIRLLGSYHKLMKKIKPNVVLTYTIKPNIYGSLACRLNKVPYLVNITGLGSAFERGGMVQKIVVNLYRTALKKANCVFFQNEYNRSVFEQFKIKGKTTRLLPGSGVNLERHNQEEYPTEEVGTCLFVGRIMKEKGIEEFLYAIRKSQEEKLPIRFQIIGKYEEDYQAEVEEMVKKGWLSYLPYQKIIHPYYKEAQVIAVPSYHEGMSNVILEASAVGRPILASDIPGCQEGLDDGVSGFTFEVRNKESFYQAIKKFSALSLEEKKNMGKEARLKMEKEFDRNIIIQIYNEILEEMFD